MIASPIITPFRWYSKFYEQTKFDVDCSNDCEFKLITDRGHLLPFQFKKDAGLSIIDSWVLRRSCDAAEPKLLSQEDSIFYGDFQSNWAISGTNCDVRTIDTGSNRTLSDGSIRTIGVVYCNTAEKECNILRTGSTNGTTGTLTNLLTIGKKYRLSVTIGDISLVTGSNLYVKFLNGTTVLINNVNSLGYYEFEFTATAVDFSFYVVADMTVDATDYIGIQEIQIVEIFSTNVNDITLDKSLLKVKNFGDYDYIVYCGTDLGISLPTGDYYSIIKTYDNNVFYSEVITVKSFIPEKSSYYILEWSNECDIQDVIFQTVNGCNYKNRIYLNEAIISKPEYPFKEEVQTDGNNDNIPVFQKWEKEIQFIIGKCPEYIVDAVTGIRLHDTISITKPLRKEQIQAIESTLVKSVEYDIAYIINDCFANVVLKMLVEDKYIDSACCTNTSPTACRECDYTVNTPPNDFTEDCDGCYAFALNGDAADGLYLYNSAEEQWDYWAVPDGTIVCVQEDVYIYSAFNNTWYLLPSIQNVVFDGISLFTVYGIGYPNSFIRVDVSLDAGATWTNGTEFITSSAFINTGMSINLAAEPEIRFRAYNFTLNCDYGFSESFFWFDE